MSSTASHNAAKAPRQSAITTASLQNVIWWAHFCKGGRATRSATLQSRSPETLSADSKTTQRVSLLRNETRKQLRRIHCDETQKETRKENLTWRKQLEWNNKTSKQFNRFPFMNNYDNVIRLLLHYHSDIIIIPEQLLLTLAYFPNW